MSNLLKMVFHEDTVSVKVTRLELFRVGQLLSNSNLLSLKGAGTMLSDMVHTLTLP